MDDKTNLHEKFNRAITMERQGNYLHALDEYIKIISENKNFREAYLNLGSLYARMKRYKEAMQCYSMAQELREDYLTYFNIGSIFYTQGLFKKAIFNLQKARNMHPGFTLSILVTGLCYSRLKNIKAAESNFIQVLNSSPNNRVALTALAMIYYNNKKYDEAVILLNRLLNINSANHVIRELKSEILFKSGRIDDSIVELKTLKKKKIGYTMYDEFIKSVPVEAYTDRYGTMDEKINTLKEKAGTDNQSLISLSLCHLFKGETDTAIEYLIKARKKTLN
ncbi:MAG TPA: CDC27 family protein [Spirochaetota bacterium]|nr:CDC27 family protein [Spirochaetota bacterium]HPI87758.1 CDC27 family protein [Spirochaetota bacterium]HPR50032.1 CDC27 family protein [Spirochaetota bacterium]